MSVDSKDILKVAQSCCDLDCEPGFRSCISRSYYAMFHESLANLKNVPSYSSNHHAGLISYMTSPAQTKSEPFDSYKLKVMGYNLKQQRDARNESDYHIKEVTVSKDMALTSIAAANLYFSKWEDLKLSIAS